MYTHGNLFSKEDCEQVIKIIDIQSLSPSHDLDVKVTLFIDKSPPGSNVSGLLDGNITMDTYKDRDFYELLLIENKGLIIPYDLKEEDNDEFMFRSFIIDP
jgi:hypothetical protein